MNEENNEIDKMSFEEAMTALEDLVNRLEAGGIDLDESLEIYEKAVALRNHCKSILEDGQRRIQKIMDTSEGIQLREFQE